LRKGIKLISFIIIFILILFIFSGYRDYGGGTSKRWVLQQIIKSLDDEYLLREVKIVESENIVKVVFPAPIEVVLSDTLVDPVLIYQSDSTIVRVPRILSKWIVAADHGDSVFIGTLPKNAIILEVQLWVQQRFNAIDTNTVEVGHPNNHDAYIVETDIGSVGRKTNNNVADGVRVGKLESVEREMYAYVVCTGSNPTIGKAHITIIWAIVDQIPD
jgi:hypothetical protein